ncbi:SRPBCC family protein [Sphingomonas astaxanthinifaciens]|uniref:ATPase n=1 Tax=Sphingomonas astaxanthinifaciens DSM 22298 TaxID=1123267 RepID=A0ABQ5ZA79_9SPHN|nr:SRPBCC domain-containing protein [Sphingomonas astaxanthinifaciens]GLR47778.1 ATPase [Sphingomonas astaxanthinifaciens DSM 22298]
MRQLAIGLAVMAAASPALAEVKSAGSNGFEVEQRAEVAVPPAILYRAFADLPGWWSDAHTYSGKAANLSLDLRPGGCWCERLPRGGGVEHMRVAYVEPGKRVVLTGSLGPLLAEATTGVMQVAIDATPTGSVLVINYRAAGFFKGGAAKLAPAVDEVLGEQVKRIGPYAAGLARR